MKKETKIIIFQYSILLAILFIGFYSIFYFKSQKLSQIIAILGMSVGYFLWGIYRHLSEKNLYFKIVVEYAMLAVVIAVLLIIFVLMLS